MNLTNEEIRIRIAEILGLERVFYTPTAAAVRRKNWPRSSTVPVIPNYPESRDACAEFEKTLTDEGWDEYSDHLSDAAGVDSWSILAGKDRGAIISATPLQRCIAYLKTKGLIP